MKTQKNVHEMMVALGLHLPHEKYPGLKGLKWKLLRSLIDEEVNQELLPAMKQLEVASRAETPDDEIVMEWWVQVLDGLVDSIVVLHNTSNAMGIDLEPFWDEVHRSNMAKAGGPKRADGKALKPDDWTPPDIQGLLERLLYDGGRQQKMSYELAVAYDHGGSGSWEAGHFFHATSVEDACTQFADELHVRSAPYAQIWVYSIQELECSPGCRGLDIFDADFDPPDGWVHIERCDECDVFTHDQAAAESISNDVRFICVDCDPEDQIPMKEWEAEEHEHQRFRVIVPADDALKAGLHRLPTLTENQIQFCRDALRAGLEVDYSYSGRGMEGKTCPAVRLDDIADFKTTAGYNTDQMGKGFVVYARS